MASVPMDDGLTPALELEAVAFSYAASGSALRRQSGRIVFDRLNWTVADGEILGIIGPNGAGKSTLLRCLAGILRPTHGRIRLFGTDLTNLGRQGLGRHIAYVPQEFSTPFPFTMREIVLMGRFPHRPPGFFGLPGWERPEDYAQATQALADLNLLSLADRPLDELSSGERQMACLARALAQQSRLLLLDEPTAFLDINHQLEICRTLQRIRRERRLTIVLVSHDLNLASQYCDRLLLMARGTTLGPDRPAAVLRSATLTDAYGCPVLVDVHPDSGQPRIGLPGPAG